MSSAMLAASGHRYPGRDGVYDEMRGADGAVRPHWRYLMESLGGLGRDGLRARQREVQRLLQDEGVTYNRYSAPGGPHQVWPLDPVPLVISSEEWATIEAGLIQRAELLNLILTDLYGPQELLRHRLLPPELVLSHPGFLRPCRGIPFPASHQLTLCAADLARAPDGSIWVIGDRTQAPSGAGYALKNRTIISRVMPSLYRDAQVHRLAMFFRTLRGSLTGLAPNGNNDPRVVLLSPGVHNESYFEHTYLAAYLGLTLVEGDDLVVRDGRVWLRSTGQLEPVDVVLRRVDDDFCDPLELRPDSQLGVPGLLEAARRGQVSIANPLGSGVLENPGLLAFLPSLCRHLLGQPLRLPSLATWWCGQKDGEQHVLGNLERMVIKEVGHGMRYRTYFGSRIGTRARRQLAARIAARPSAFSGQEESAFSTVPALSGGALAPRAAVLRTYLVAREDGYAVMAGGLTRIARRDSDLIITNQAGGVSKDTWVLASEPERQVSLTQPFVTGAVPGVVAPLSGRAAEGMFWLGRYTERAESIARLMQVIVNAYSGNPAGSNLETDEHLKTLLQSLTHLTVNYPGFIDPATLLEPEAELLALIADRHRPETLMATLDSGVSAAREVRDLLSADSWRVINDLDRLRMRLATAPPAELAGVSDLLAELITTLMAFAGLSMESMTREQGWLFLDLGRRLERGLALVSLLRSNLVKVVDAETTELLTESVLRTLDSVITYR
ncbi:MAG: circularly permuted type 2 ATP-grasp protein, partial [Pseudomonadota bacterium]|nr:circularly permuted type 2 ATP-grasp protein [Pseudomonadota bacterium]